MAEECDLPGQANPPLDLKTDLKDEKNGQKGITEGFQQERVLGKSSSQCKGPEVRSVWLLSEAQGCKISLTQKLLRNADSETPPQTS